jgi:hypothetical protein
MQTTCNTGCSNERSQSCVYVAVYAPDTKTYEAEIYTAEGTLHRGRKYAEDESMLMSWVWDVHDNGWFFVGVLLGCKMHGSALRLSVLGYSIC